MGVWRAVIFMRHCVRRRAHGGLYRNPAGPETQAGAGFRYNAKNASLNRRADLGAVDTLFNTLVVRPTDPTDRSDPPDDKSKRTLSESVEKDAFWLR